MAVFTEVSPDDARALLARLDVGDLVSLRGITSGIENTNYFVDTDRGAWVLTIFERLTFEQLPFYLELMRHLARRGLPVPEPQAARLAADHADGESPILHTLHGKPCALVNKLRGTHVLAPGASHCAQLGRMLAGMHLAGADFPRTQPNLRGLAWWQQTIPLVRPFLCPDQDRLIVDELAFQLSTMASAAAQALPRGPVHADLFRDNAMFEGDPGHERLTGVFDFYFAGVDALLFDIAVCINDWCIDLDSGRLDEPRAVALLAAYDAVRPLDANEHRLLPAYLRAAALRFWISRLWDLHLPRDAKMLEPHDPTHFERVLRARIDDPWHGPRGG
jgi:homoserine kinase type II